jgi:tetratricopeptide (TPR) repeat protein
LATARARHLRPALQHLIEARNRCPVLAHPHARLAEQRAEFISPDSASVYWERAMRLLPFDPELWFACAQQHLEDGRAEKAWPLWRRYLETTDRKLATILERAAPILGPDGVREALLPDHPGLLIAAGEQLFPKPDEIEKRRPFIEKAISNLDRADPQNGLILHQKAVLLKSLNEVERALDSYRAALKMEPRQTTWRFELAMLLRDQGRLDDAHTELETIKRQAPERKDIRDWLQVVEREIRLKSRLNDDKPK